MLRTRYWLLLLIYVPRGHALGPSDELIAMIKSHNNQDNIISFVQAHPETINAYVAGYTPLMHAIFEGLSDVAQRLILAKADIHLKDQNTLATALMHAVSYDLPDVTEMLLRHHARFTDTDTAGKTVWDYLKNAKSMGKPNAEIIETLLQRYVLLQNA